MNENVEDQSRGWVATSGGSAVADFVSGSFTPGVSYCFFAIESKTGTPGWITGQNVVAGYS